MQFLPVHHAQIRSAAGLSLADHFKEPRILFLCVADQYFSAPFERKMKFFRKFAHHAVPLHAEGSLQRAHVVGEASVDDTGISGACLISDVRVLFKDADLQTVSRKFTGDCTADNSAADDQNVISMFHEIPP